MTLPSWPAGTWWRPRSWRRRTWPSEGIQARVLDCHTIKPLDREAILRAARETGGIVTAEDHTIVGGLGSAVCEVVAEGHPTSVRRVGLRDTFASSGRDWKKLLAHYHIDHAGN